MDKLSTHLQSTDTANLDSVLLLSSDRCLQLMFSAHLRKTMFCWRCSRLNDQFVIPSKGLALAQDPYYLYCKTKKISKKSGALSVTCSSVSLLKEFCFYFCCICLSEYPRNCTELMLTSLLLILP